MTDDGYTEIEVDLPLHVIEHLERVAALKGVTPNDVAIEILQNYINDHAEEFGESENE